MSKSTVLLVDDEEMILKVTSRILERDGYQVQTAVCSAEAVAILERVRVDVIVCDHRMPGRSGLDLLSEVRDEHPDVMMIVLSGGMSAVQASQAIIELGVHEVLQKPCPGQTLCAAVRSAIECRAAAIS